MSVLLDGLGFIVIALVQWDIMVKIVLENVNVCMVHAVVSLEVAHVMESIKVRNVIGVSAKFSSLNTICNYWLTEIL